MLKMWGQLSSTIGSFLFFWAMIQKYIPDNIGSFIDKSLDKLFFFIHPYLHVSFEESTGRFFNRNEAFTAIESYLSDKSTVQAKRLRGHVAKSGQPIVLNMDDQQEVHDHFDGVDLLWSKIKLHTSAPAITLYPSSNEKRLYRLTFHRRHRHLVTGPYLDHVLTEGRANLARKRQRKLYTNNGEGSGYDQWNHVVFEHPATFQTLAMNPIKKKEIMDDLATFRESKDYYSRIGKAWKRGYLLYGPPGTGKSTMIAAIANFLNYDIYDLELTAVKSNMELRNLLIETSSKSIIVIEDIDCSLDLTGKRKGKRAAAAGENKVVSKVKQVIGKTEKDEDSNSDSEEEKKDKSKQSKVTLSGLLNFIDGIWSATGGERLIIFTTNYKEKLDEALIRRGRMDKHIELSYCDFESFKVLAKNYLSLDSHPLFGTISELLGETKMTPADVAENLMPKTTVTGTGDHEACLETLIKALKKKAKEEAEKKAAEEVKLKSKDKKGHKLKGLRGFWGFRKKIRDK